MAPTSGEASLNQSNAAKYLVRSSASEAEAIQKLGRIQVAEALRVGLLQGGRIMRDCLILLLSLS